MKIPIDGHFWAKYRESPSCGDAEWHPLQHHAADVGACLEALLSLPVLRRRLAATGGISDLDRGQVQRLALMASLHDVGKFNHGFQGKIFERTRGAGHVKEAAYLVCRPEMRKRFLEALGIGKLHEWSCGQGALRLLLAAFSHHGRPCGDPEDVRPDLWERNGTRDPFDGIHDLGNRLRRWFPSAFEDPPRLPDAPAFQHAFCGLVTLADWIGSDTRFFPFSSSLEEDRMSFAREAAGRALKKIGTDSSESWDLLQQGLPDFHRTFGWSSPRPVQRTIDKIRELKQVLVLEAETGSGKTEAAFRYFLRLLNQGRVDGLYFALPTRSAATQIHRRVLEYTRNTFGRNAPPVILAVPGYIRADDAEGAGLPGFEVRWDDEERMRHRGWAAERPKRFMAASLVVGTVDQVLLSGLQVPHAHMRASALVRHLLVVDEVHASDAYMSAVLRSILQRHVQAGGYALLMSATLGASARARFAGCDVPAFEKASALPYPALTAIDAASMVTHGIRSSQPAKSVKVELARIGEDPHAVARAAVNHAMKGGLVLVIRNTVREAVETHLAVENLQPPANLVFTCRGVKTLHHRRFAAEDRKQLDEAIESRFKNRRVAGVAVATQTVEQSLDIDCDLLITDICPMDVLLQRIGRLHRHPGTRRAGGFESPRVLVLLPKEEELGRFIRSDGSARGPMGLGTVYEDLRIIEATIRAIESRSVLDLPRMNRELVERATHPSSLEAVVSQAADEAWERHAHHMDGVSFAQGGVAGLNLVDWSVPFGNADACFAAAVKVPTRLGEDDRLAVFPEPFSSPFGETVKELPIPGWMVPGAGPGENPSEISVGPGCVSFRFGGEKFVYDRLGLRKSDA